MIGTRLRESRKKEKLTLQELAKMTGFTASYISQIERELVEPSITALRKFCEVLDEKLYFFLEDEPSDPIVVRRDRRQKLKLPDSTVSYEFVSPMSKHKSYNPKVEVIEIEIQPHEWSSEDMFSHDADEIIMVLRGELSITINDGEEALKAGDSIYIIPNTLHKFYNPTDEKTRILSIITPAIY